MDKKIEELKKDLTELQLLESQAERPRIKDVLSLEVRKITTEITKLQEHISKENPASPTTNSASTSNPADKRYQIKLNNYGWDQSTKFVKFYITLPKVETISDQNVVCKFTPRSLELNVTSLENKNYIFVINNLLGAIDPEKSNWKVKKDMVLINAAKVDSFSWSHVTELEKKVRDKHSQKFKPNEDMDPQAGIMSLMQNMYNEGDDDMKRTIAKAWSESQNKSSQL